MIAMSLLRQCSLEIFSHGKAKSQESKAAQAELASQGGGVKAKYALKKPTLTNKVETLFVNVG